MRTGYLASLCCVLTALGLLLALPPQPASATKEYARREKKDCNHCHISDKGAGPRNEIGREYEANGHEFGVQSWSSVANKRKYLRARSALLATWYGEAGRLLDELETEETLPGGLALIGGTRKKFTMFQKAWLRSAKKLLEKGSRGLPNALRFLVKLESQFPTSSQGKEAISLLDSMAREAKKKSAVAEARAGERVRLMYLEGRTEAGLANYAAARGLLEMALADPRGAPLAEDIREILAEFPARRSE